MNEDKPRILVIGAHPDDADIKAGGTAALWRDLGFAVRMLSVTDGRHGHQSDWGDGLARRRKGEAAAAGAVIGARYDVWDYPDGQLLPSIEARERVIRLVREFRPDLLITHRAIDYHPDHRYVSQLVQDAAYMVTVPGICPEVPHLPQNPVILYFSDAFRDPRPFRPDVAVDVGPQWDRMIAMLDRHVSQFYEWLPFNGGYADEVPAADDPERRRRWLDERIRRRVAPLADRYRDLLLQTYGPDRGRQVRYIEAFEVSEVGAPLDAETRARVFPFLPSGGTPDVKDMWNEAPDLR